MLMTDIGFESHLLVRSFWAFVTILVTGIIMFSMHRITHYQRQLMKGNDVFNSERLMKFHLFNFIVVSVLEIVAVGLEGAVSKDEYKDAIQQKQDDPDYDIPVKYKRIDDAKIINDICLTLIWIIIVITMFVMYLRYSAPITINESNFIK